MRSIHMNSPNGTIKKQVSWAVTGCPIHLSKIRAEKETPQKKMIRGFSKTEHRDKLPVLSKIQSWLSTGS